MKTLTVNIEDPLSEKAVTAVLDALKLDYELDDLAPFENETERIMSNPYLVEKINQGREDMEKGKGKKIPLKDLWK